MKLSVLLLASVASASVVFKREGYNSSANGTDVTGGTTTLTSLETAYHTVYPSSAAATASETGGAPVVSSSAASEAASSAASGPSTSNEGSFSGSSSASAASPTNYNTLYKSPNAIKPKAFIISMFDYEAIWFAKLDFVHNITVPGLSPLFPWVHCTTNYSVCQFITGESEINAAASVTALTLAPMFDLSETYFLVAGIGGGEPTQVTLGSAAFAEYAVQVALEDQIDSREVLPKYNWTTGYFPYDTDSPLAYPEQWYGTEVFKVNSKLRDRAFDLASEVQLAVGTKENTKFRELYDYAPANQPPSVVKCDVVTSDNYWSGTVLSAYFSNLTSLMTNGSATYCSTAQEDNATLESMMRAHLFGLVDYGRVVVMRTISDFARAPPKYADDAVNFFTNVSQGGSYVAIENIYRAGLPFIQDVLSNWDTLYKTNSFKDESYLGDVFGTLGGTPSFGPGGFVEPQA